MVKDRQGEKLNVGDRIWFTFYGDADIQSGVITKFSNSTIKIDIMADSSTWRNKTTMGKIMSRYRILKKQ